MSHRPIRFFHRGAVVEVDGAAAAPTRTVLEWLRENAHRTGSKEGCAEGDCGACTVVVGEPDGAGGLSLQPVNACIRFLPTLDGRALFTVEDVAAPGAALHPVQQALVDHHGSQCGFCTPGFVMTLWAGVQRHAGAGTVPSRQQLADDVSGNLCRCTGYRPILDAAEAVFAAPLPPGAVLDPAPALAALGALAADPPLHIDHRRGSAGGACYHAPRSTTELAALRLAFPAATLLAGGTDVGLWVTKQHKALPQIVFLGDVAELKTVAWHGDTLHIGAAASLEAAFQALAAEWPGLHEVGLRFASPPLRAAGTLVGNLANGSPIGDAAPVLMALGAQLHLRRGEAQRSVSLDDFYTGYMANRLEPGEFVEAVSVARTPGLLVQADKISKRFDSDISAVCAGLALRLDDDAQVVQARFAYGGMAATVRRAAGAERAVLGKPWSEATVRAAMAALSTDFQPLDDLRASAGYRLQVAGNLLLRLWLQTRPDAPLPQHALRIWPARTVAAA